MSYYYWVSDVHIHINGYVHTWFDIFRGTRNPLQRIFRTQDSKDQVVFRLYREFQIVVKFYNKVFQTVFIPTLVATAIFVIIICLYTCIKLHKVIPMPGFAFFPLLSTDGFSVIFISRIASIVYIKVVITKGWGFQNYYNFEMYTFLHISVQVLCDNGSKFQQEFKTNMVQEECSFAWQTENSIRIWKFHWRNDSASFFGL